MARKSNLSGLCRLFSHCCICRDWVAARARGLTTLCSRAQPVEYTQQMGTRFTRVCVEEWRKVVKVLFPKHPLAQWTYDLVALALFAIAAYLGWKHAVWWQVSLAASAFFAATFISLMNRERLESLKRRHKPTKP